MPGPARAGLFVYALDLPRVAAFYEAIGGMRRLHQTAELCVLESPDIQLLVHAIPEAHARGVVISRPPQRREQQALKFFFTVPDLGQATVQAAALGGEVFPERWPGPGFVVANAMDPEGNVCQLRAATPAGP